MNIKEELKKITILDKYILRQIIEMFLMGVLVFTSIIFASDTFITLIKQISMYGIPFKIALMMIILSLPSVFVMTIPMGVLLSTVMTLNRLSLASEITVMRSCGVGLNRIAKPIFAFAIVMCLTSFFINEAIVPVTTKQSKDLALWALGQKNIPEGKTNFIFKELSNGNLKRLFYVGHCKNKKLNNVTLIDVSRPDTVQIMQSRYGASSPEKGWVFQKGALYTIDSEGKVLNTAYFNETVAQFGMNLSKEMNKNMAKERNFVELVNYLATEKNLDATTRRSLYVELFDKVALPVTTIVFVLLGVPLAITPPRVRYNRGFLFSILIIFFYYLIRALSLSVGEAGQIPTFLAAWLPNIVLSIVGCGLYYRKVYTIT